VVIYEAFVEGQLEAPSTWRAACTTLLRAKVRGISVANHLSLSNAFTSAFKELDPIPQFKATASSASSGSTVLKVVLAHGAVSAAASTSNCQYAPEALKPWN